MYFKKGVWFMHYKLAPRVTIIFTILFHVFYVLIKLVVN